MKQIAITVNIQSFEVPDGVFESIKPMPAPPKVQSASRVFELSELDPDTLYCLCKDFKREVFKKAGKLYPPVAIAMEKPSERIYELAHKLIKDRVYLEHDECRELSEFIMGL